MKVATALGLILALALGSLAVLQVSDLQDLLEGAGNNVGLLSQNITSIVVIVLGLIGGGTLIAFFAWAFAHNRQ